jgi:F1F0 ATPase subunit 2
MNWVAAVVTGVGLGLVNFGGLWVTARGMTAGWTRGLLWASQLARLGLVAVGFFGLSREGADMALAGLAGLWLARWALVRHLGGGRHVR